MTKFTIALRELGTYKEVLRSQVVCFFYVECDRMHWLRSQEDLLCSLLEHCCISYRLCPIQYLRPLDYKHREVLL
jgi:hypothetical protein